MEPYIIPIDPTVPSQSFLITLDGATFTIRTDYINRMSGWIVGIYDANLEPIVVGERVSRDWPLFKGHADRRLPAGQFICVGLDEGGGEPEADQLGGDAFKVIYFEGGGE